jgi:EAL domain-containing protein (putative c-di-GMP-specific phosphodiesterase class I)
MSATAIVEQGHGMEHFPFDLVDFFVVYQPIYDISTGTIVKIEVLLRWKRFTEVERFIKHFENTGQITDLTVFVIKNVCTDLEAIHVVWDHPVVAINFSPSVLVDPLFIANVISLFVSSGIPSHWIEIEITESERLNPDAVIECANIFHKGGFKLSLDDFGIGSSSFVWLKKIPISVLKIDRSFIAAIGGCFVNHAILSSISYLGKEMGIKCVAEGVETQEQVNFLKKIGINYVQGFFFSRPLSLDALLILFVEHDGGGQI